MSPQRDFRAFVSARMVRGEDVRPGCCLVDDAGRICEVRDGLPPGFRGKVVDCADGVLLPGLVDSHVHVNEPGRTDWEGFATATQAAAAGGITTIVDMPLNCIPVTTSANAFQEKLGAIQGQLWVDAGFWGGVTRDSLNDLPELLKSGILGVKSFLIDSGIPDFPPLSLETIEPAMRQLATAKLPYLFHAELPLDGPTEAGALYADFVATRPPRWENEAVRLVIRHAEATGCRSHIVHLSSAEALSDLVSARGRGVPISAETCPHYLILDAETVDRSVPAGERSLFKCCPPIRSRDNAELLWAGLRAGTLELVVSDHSPCTAELKHLGDAQGLAGAWGGISSLQFGLPLIWSQAETRGFGLPDLVRWMCGNPARLAGLAAHKGAIEVGRDADLVVFDPDSRHLLAASDILYKNKFSPYIGQTVRGSVLRTYLRGELVAENGRIPPGPGPRGRPLLHPLAPGPRPLTLTSTPNS